MSNEATGAAVAPAVDQLEELNLKGKEILQRFRTKKSELDSIRQQELGVIQKEYEENERRIREAVGIAMQPPVNGTVQAAVAPVQVTSPDAPPRRKGGRPPGKRTPKAATAGNGETKKRGRKGKNAVKPAVWAVLMRDENANGLKPGRILEIIHAENLYVPKESDNLQNMINSALFHWKQKSLVWRDEESGLYYIPKGVETPSDALAPAAAK